MHEGIAVPSLEHLHHLAVFHSIWQQDNHGRGGGGAGGGGGGGGQGSLQAEWRGCSEDTHASKGG